MLFLILAAWAALLYAVGIGKSEIQVGFINVIHQSFAVPSETSIGAHDEICASVHYEKP